MQQATDLKVTQQPGIRLLALIDALVRRDVEKPDFKGTVSLGVRTPAGDTYWLGDFAAQATTRFLAAAPQGADATLLVDEAVAESILMQGVLPSGGGLLQLRGDGELLKRFFARYTQKRSWLDIRAGR